MKLLTTIGNEVTELNLGRVKVGQSKEYEFTLFNENDSVLEDIQVKFDAVRDSKEIEVLKIPDFLGAKEKAIFKFRWTPTLEIKKGLRTKVIFNAVEVFG